MSGTDSKISDRRKRNNIMIGIVLFSFVGLVFAITVAKMMAGQNMEAFDHAVRPALEQAE